MTEVIASRSPPYGWIILTFLYITFGLITILAHDGDNSLLSTVRYATSFFMMSMTFIFALHLGILATNFYGVLAFASLCIGYIFEGCSGLVFDNSEGHFFRMEPNTFSFYLFNLVTYFFWTVSAVLFGIMFRETWGDLEFKSWATKLSKMCSIALILSMLAIFIACIWCMFFASVDVGDNVLDEASSKSEHRDQVAVHYFRASIWTWDAMLFLFFLVTASGLRPIMYAIQDEADIIVWGLSSVWAADGIVFFQFASFAFLLFFILEGTGKAQVSSSALNYVLLAFNYSILVTFFFLHNVVFSLSHIVFDHDDEEDDVEANAEKLADTTSECTSFEGRRTIPGPDGAEIVMSGISGVTSMGATTAKSEHEALPTAGPGGIKTFLRMASMRKPEITRIRSANIRLEESDSYSDYSTSSYGDESYDDEEDNTTLHSSIR